jgi:hypothetical protein
MRAFPAREDLSSARAAPLAEHSRRNAVPRSRPQAVWGSSTVSIVIRSIECCAPCDQAYRNRKSISVEGIEVPVISVEDLLVNKRSSGRIQDLADVEKLESQLKKNHDQGKRIRRAGGHVQAERTRPARSRARIARRRLRVSAAWACC